MSYRVTQWATMKPNVYGGPKCDKIVPRWHVYAEGDKDSDFVDGPLKLDGRTFPPGTTVTIKEPVCPDCGEVRSPIYPTPKRGPLYKGKCDCGFDWDEWVVNEYS